MGSPITDQALWRLATADDLEAFRRLYERHAVGVEAFCLRRTADRTIAEDATSEVFLELWRQRRRLTVPGDSARPLLLGIALNVLRRRWRIERRHRTTVQRLSEAFERSPPAGNPPAATLEALARAREIVESLPRREAETLILIAWGELSYEETAAALGVPIGTVRSRLARARNRLTGPSTEPLHLAKEP
jgi:RNA polymerase sigma-70 factor (ECF subfamily)